MSFSKLCPICKTIKIFRKEVKTCGSHDCMDVWRSLTATQKAKIMNHSEETTQLEPNIEQKSTNQEESLDFNLNQIKKILDGD